jgi:hypothetical protein
VSGWRLTLRFFRVVRPVPRLTRLAFAGITTVSAVVIVTSATTRPRVLLPVLVLQAFTVSTGFVSYARRGHFDVLFTAGVDRVQAAVMYWALAALPGACCWITLALVELAVHRQTALFTAGSCAAIVMLSTIPWATSAPLGRFSGTIGWLLLLVLATALTPAGLQAGQLWMRGPDDTWWFGIVAFLLYPARLIGAGVNDNIPALLAGLLLASASMVTAVICIARSDVALETGQ